MRALALLVVLGTLFTQSDSVRALLSDQASSVDEWDPRTASISTSWGDIMLEVRHIQDAPSSGGVLSRLHRSYKKIGYSAKLCIEALTKSAQQERSMTLVNESTSLRAHTCERSTGWADPRWSAAETTGALPGAKDVPATRRSTRLLMDEAEILFVVMAFVPNPLNARLLDLCLASLAAFHPRANVLVVDNGSPRRDLVEAVLGRRRAAAGAAAAAAATDAAVAEAKGATAAALAARSRIFLATAHGGPALPPNEALLVARSALGGSVAEHAHLARHARQPLGMEIGALRAAVAFVEAHALSAAGKPPPALVVALPHSTGLRLPLPLPEMTEKLASATCAAFALEVGSCVILVGDCKSELTVANLVCAPDYALYPGRCRGSGTTHRASPARVTARTRGSCPSSRASARSPAPSVRPRGLTRPGGGTHTGPWPCPGPSCATGCGGWAF